MPSLTLLKRQICDIGRRMWQRGMCAGNDGNISCRLPNGSILATPTGISKGFMIPSMIVRVDPRGRPIDRSIRRQPTSEIFLHLAIYRRRPDVQAVIHAHAPFATAFACSEVPLPRGVYPEAEVCLGAVPTVPYSTPGQKQLGEQSVRHIGPDTRALLLGNHGAVTFGKDLLDAYYKLEMLESYCQILLLLKQIGRVNHLKPAQLAALTGKAASLSQPSNRSFFRR